MDEVRWLLHYRNNQLHRPEPDWNAPRTLTPESTQIVAWTVAQLQLGDGGGPGCLIARDAEQYRSTSEGTRQLVDLWFREEKEHSRLLGCLLARLGGTLAAGHWSFTCFCWVRRVLGVRFELMALLLTELAVTIYYRMMRKYIPDVAVRQVCNLILRDESGHLAFHRDRMVRSVRKGKASFGLLQEAWLRFLCLGAATMLWINHSRAVTIYGATTSDFYVELWREMSTFFRRLRRDIRPRQAQLESATHGATGALGTRRQAGAPALG